MDSRLLEEVLRKEDISSVIHLAGKKSVSESQKDPLKYYIGNVSGTLSLLNAMSATGIKKMVFSSTATVYGNSGKNCLSETDELGPINNYGKSKLMVEEILQELWTSDKTWSFVILRYFNPVGAHRSGLIGEDPKGIPANIMPFISQVEVGKLPELKVFGNDYPTRDGTGARDYIHIEDLASRHLAALDFLYSHNAFDIFSLGTGSNTTVLELVHAFEKANEIKIPYSIVERRPGDSASCYANPAKA